MKPLNIYELDLICQELEHLKSSPLQEVRFSGTDLEFGFWTQGRKSWWHLSLDTKVPLLLPIPSPKLSRKSQKKPIYLFLKAHALGKRLETITRDKKLGRVIVMTLKGEEGSCDIEMRLFPHGQNLIVRGNGKQVSMKPVKTLGELEDSKTPETCRSLRDLEFPKARPPSPEKQPLQKQMAKLARSIEKVSQDLANKEKLPWKQVGEHLVQTQSLEVISEWKSYVNPTENLAWNIENCFSKAKLSVHKIEGGKTRLAKLQKELQDLKEGKLQKPSPILPFPSSQMKVRKMNLEGGLEAWVGRNASENIKLLRQAKAWDLWVHLVDHPSSHGLIRRPKGFQVPHSAIVNVGKWIVRMTFGEKSRMRQGDHFEILYTECRYVSPIKGDKIGRVTYRNEKVIGFKF